MADAAGSEGRARGLLALGAAVGLAAALAGLVGGQGGDGPLPPGVVAEVNGAPIATESWGRALAGLAADRREPVGEEQRRFVLDRLIEEELLVQRGLELGLARHDRRVRGDLVSAVMDGIVAEAEAVEPTEDELRAFHAENRDWFTRPGRLHVRRLWVSARGGDPAAAEARAEQAAARLRAGEPFAAVDAELGDPAVAELPDALLPAAKLREYLGPTALRAASELETGGIGGPVRAGGGYHVLWLRAREEPRSAPFDEVREQVASEWRRRGGEQALRAYLDRLRGRAQVRVAEPLP